jgi:hypothetical protein
MCKLWTVETYVYVIRICTLLKYVTYTFVYITDMFYIKHMCNVQYVL